MTSAAAAAPENGAITQGEIGRAAGGGAASVRGGTSPAAADAAAISSAVGSTSGATCGCDSPATSDEASATASAGAGWVSLDVASRSMVGGGRLDRPVSEACPAVSDMSSILAG